MSIVNILPIEVLPRHIGIIMDGNGRWAKKRNLPRIYGHQNGVLAVQKTVQECVRLGIEALTLYSFSTENWKRPQQEIKLLMQLLETFLQKELQTILDHNIQLKLIGKLERLPQSTQNLFLEVLEKTKDQTGLTLALAIDYGSRDEITSTFHILINKVLNKELDITEINEETISNHLFTKDMPPLDLLIRTSGEQRISNFLLWQSAYAEFYFSEIYWPDFNKKEFHKALQEFSKRQRRYGQITQKEPQNKEQHKMYQNYNHT